MSLVKNLCSFTDISEQKTRTMYDVIETSNFPQTQIGKFINSPIISRKQIWEPLGVFLSELEKHPNSNILPESYFTIRLDGKSFSGNIIPRLIQMGIIQGGYSLIIEEAMKFATLQVFNSFANSICAFTQSDEITILVGPFNDKVNGKSLSFEDKGNIQKYLSHSASLASSSFLVSIIQNLIATSNSELIRKLFPVQFDSRIAEFNSFEAAFQLILCRSYHCGINGISSGVRFSGRKMPPGIFTSQKLEILNVLGLLESMGDHELYGTFLYKDNQKNICTVSKPVINFVKNDTFPIQEFRYSVRKTDFEILIESSQEHDIEKILNNLTRGSDELQNYNSTIEEFIKCEENHNSLGPSHLLVKLCMLIKMHPDSYNDERLHESVRRALKNIYKRIYYYIDKNLQLAAICGEYRYFVNHSHLLNDENRAHLFAISEGKISEYLLQSHVDLNKFLISSIKFGNIEKVKYLISIGADFNCENCITVAAENDHLEIVKLLFKMGANIHNNDESALRFACQNGYFRIVKFLVENGAELDNKCGKSPLGFIHVRYEPENARILEFLLEKGAGDNNELLYFLQWVCEVGNVKIVKLILKRNINLTTFGWFGCFLTACRRDNIEIIQLFLNHGVNVSLNDNEPLKLACKVGNVEIVRLLIKHGADVSAGQDKPLRIACYRENVKLAKLLIEHGANVCAKDGEPLRLAYEKNNSELIELLSLNGAFLQEKII
jgi:ankyrin repeat protein/tRNA(His) 5'-end guanylyltransferase